jgi:hypothetical protein
LPRGSATADAGAAAPRPQIARRAGFRCAFASDASCTSAPETLAAVRTLCVGQPRCTISTDALNRVRDPCSGKHKRLAVRLGGCAASPAPAPAATVLTFVSTTGGGDLAWENERYHSGPLPHARYLFGGAPENVFLWPNGSAAGGGIGAPISAAYGMVIDDDHVGGVSLR